MTSNQNPITKRSVAFSRNTALEVLLKDINESLWISEQQTLKEYREPRFPVILIMGPMRSGTTLFLQWLASTNLFAYPTNLMSRFYQAPIIGAKIQLLLTDPRFSFRNELGEFAQQTDFRSENGKTTGVLAPNEFWYFWRRFLAQPQRDIWEDEELRQNLDTQTMLAELAGITDVLQKPFAAKGMIFNRNIPFLDSIFEKVIFVQIKRDPIANVASVLDARKSQLGSEDKWYSFDIPEYEQLKNLEPVAQVAGQVHFMNRAVTEGLTNVKSSRKLVVQYENFCENPEAIYQELLKKLDGLDAQYEGPERFQATRSAAFERREAIEKAIESFETQ